MGEPAKYSQLNAREEEKYMELVKRIIGYTERLERSNQRATSLIRMVLSGGTHWLLQIFRNAVLDSKITQVENEIEELFSRIDARLGTETPRVWSQFPGYNDMYKQMILAGSEKDFHL